MILMKMGYKEKMHAIHKLYECKFAVLAITATHCQCLIPANTNHTFFVAEWIPLDMVTLVKTSDPLFYRNDIADTFGKLKL